MVTRPAQAIEALLVGKSPAEQDEILNTLPMEDLENYAQFSQNMRGQAGLKGPVSTIQGNRQVIHPQGEPDDSWSDEQLEALVNQEKLPNNQAPKEKSFLDSGMGLGARGLMLGATALPGMLIDTAASEPGATATATGKIADALGMRKARPGSDGYLDRLVQSGFEGLGGVAGAGAISGGLGTVGKQALGGITGAVAGQQVRENGGGATAQIVAGLAGGLAPSALGTGMNAAARGAFRGTDPTAVREAIDTFKTAGTTPTVAQATGGERAGTVERLLSQLFPTSGIMRKRIAGQEADIGEAVQTRANQLGPKASNEAMGTKIGEDAENIFMPNARKIIDKKYERFYSMVPGSTVVPVDKFATTLDDMVATVPGAKALSTNTMLNPDRDGLASVLADLKKDIKANQGKGLPLDAVKNVRSRVGKLIENATFDSSKSTGDLKRLYGSLSETMKDAAGPVGSPSRKAFDEANGATQEYHKILDTVKPILERNGGAEKVFTSALAGTKDGGTVIRNVYYTLSPEARKAMTSAILRRAAKPMPGDPEDFDMLRFAKNYANMDDEAKKVVFGAMGGSYRTDLDAIAKTIQIIQKQKVKHGLATSASQGRTGVQGVIQGVSFGTAGLLSSLFGTGAAGAAILGTTWAAARGSRKLAKWMTNPETVHMLAETTKVPKETLPIIINQLAIQGQAMEDPDQIELAEYLKSLTQPQESK